MKEESVTLFAVAVSTLGEVLGMYAENQYRSNSDHQVAYTHESFASATERLDKILAAKTTERAAAERGPLSGKILVRGDVFEEMIEHIEAVVEYFESGDCEECCECIACSGKTLLAKVGKGGKT